MKNRESIKYEDDCNCPICRLDRIERGVYQLQEGIDELLKRKSK